MRESEVMALGFFFRNENTSLTGIEKSDNGPNGCLGQCDSWRAGSVGSRLTAGLQAPRPTQARTAKSPGNAGEADS